MNAILNSLARSLIWVLWALRSRRRSSGNRNPNSQSLQEHIINESNGNTIEYFHHQEAEFATNVLVLTGAGRENTTDNLELWKDFLGPACNVCIPNFPGYGRTSGRSGMFETTEDHILHNQKVLLDHLGWEKSKTVLIGISYGTKVPLNSLWPETNRYKRLICSCENVETL